MGRARDGEEKEESRRTREREGKEESGRARLRRREEEDLGRGRKRGRATVERGEELYREGTRGKRARAKES